MKLRKIFRLALNMILHSKLRSWLTIIGIVIGVASIVSIISVGTGFETAFEQQLSGFGSDIISVVPGYDRAQQDNFEGAMPSTNINPLTNKEYQTLRSIPGLSLISGGVQGSSEVYYLGESSKLEINGVDLINWGKVISVDIEKGRLLGPGDTNSILIGGSIAEDLFKNKVDINRNLIIGGKSLRVVGVIQKGSMFGSFDKSIFMDINAAREILNKAQGNFDYLSLKVKNIDEVERVQDDVEQKLFVVRHVNKDTQDFTIVSTKAIKDRVSTVLAGFTMFLGVIAAVSLLVGAVGIANTMFTSVLEKTREIGIMKALGAKNKDILLIFLFNSGMVGLVGGVIGVLLGMAISALIPSTGLQFGPPGMELITVVSVDLILFALAFSLFLGMLSGVIPAYRASKLKPVDALRSE